MKSRRRLVLLICAPLVFTFAALDAQDAPIEFGQQTVYLEALGNSSMYALSFDQQFAKQFSVRAGIGSGGIDHTIGPTGSLLISYLTGTVHKLEISFGYVSSLKTAGFGTSLFIGYRFQPREDGISLRFAVNPMLAGSAPSSFGSVGNYNGIQIALGYSI